MKLCGILTQQQVENIEKSLEPLRGYGHEDFQPTILNQLILHAAKNSDYASGGSALGNFERVAAILALYPGLNLGDKRVVALVYTLKQLDAVLWGLAKNITHKVEGLVGRLNDIAVYSNIVICMIKDDARVVAIDQRGIDLPFKTAERELHAKIAQEAATKSDKSQSA